MNNEVKKLSHSERGKLGAHALNSNLEKKAEASRKAAISRGYESLAAAGRKGGLALKKRKKKDESSL